MRASAPIRGYWARKGGGFTGKDGLLTIKGRSMKSAGKSGGNSGGNRRVTVWAQLVEHAAGYGFYNGVRIAKK